MVHIAKARQCVVNHTFNYIIIINPRKEPSARFETQLSLSRQTRTRPHSQSSACVRRVITLRLFYVGLTFICYYSMTEIPSIAVSLLLSCILIKSKFAFWENSISLKRWRTCPAAKVCAGKVAEVWVSSWVSYSILLYESFLIMSNQYYHSFLHLVGYPVNF